MYNHYGIAPLPTGFNRKNAHQKFHKTKLRFVFELKCIGLHDTYLFLYDCATSKNEKVDSLHATAIKLIGYKQLVYQSPNFKIVNSEIWGNFVKIIFC